MKSFLRKSTIHNNLYSSLLQKDGEAQVLADNDVEAPAGWLVVKKKKTEKRVSWLTIISDCHDFVIRRR